MLFRSLNTAGDVVSIVLPRSTAGVVKPRNKAEENNDGVDETLRVSFAHQKSPISRDAVSPPLLRYSVASVPALLLEEGDLAPEIRKRAAVRRKGYSFSATTKQHSQLGQMYHRGQNTNERG